MFSGNNLRKRLFVNNYEQWSSLLTKPFLSDRKLEVFQVEDGIILPVKYMNEAVYRGGGFDSDMTFIAGLLRNKPPSAGAFGIKGAYEVKEVVKFDEEVIFGGVLVGLFGHFILESLGRMWYVLQNHQDKRKIVFLTVGEQQWFYSFLDLLDIERERIVILKQPTKYKKIIIPDESIHSWYNYTKEYLLPYDYIASKVKRNKIKKLYLTRSKIKLKEPEAGKYICNEEYFEQFYQSKGFSVISPEQFSIEKQISMLVGASEVVSTLGSLSHLALFCRPGTKFTMLTRVDDDTLYPQCLINEAKDIDWVIVDASMNFLPLQHRGGGVSLLGETKFWRQYVKEKYNESIMTETWKDKLEDYTKNWCYYFSIGSAAPLITSTVFRTYELIRRNEIDI